MGNYDTVIIGAGHNGLVAAAYLAKAGRKVLVLERGHQVGGAAVTEEIFPDFQVSTIADGGGYLSAKVRRDLQLDAKVDWIQSDAVVFSPQPDGEQLTIWRDAGRTADEIARFSTKDAEAYPGFVELMSSLAGMVGGLQEMTPPDLPDVNFADLRAGTGLLGPLRRLGRKRIPELVRVLPMSVTDLLDEFFESPVVKGALGASSVLGVSYGPMETGTALVLLGTWAQSDTGLFRSASVIRGGMGALTSAIADSARAFGAEIRTAAAVEKITVAGGRATGVQLASGEQISASVVASATDVTSTFLDLVGPRELDASFVRHIGNIKYRGTGTRIHLALNGLPTFTALADGELGRLSAPIQIAPSLEYVEQAYDHTKYGRYSTAPYLDLLIPTLSDPSLAPQGHHLVSMTAKFAPFHLRDGDWEEHSEIFADIAVDTLARYAPDIKSQIVARKVISLADLHHQYGLVEGSPHHGDMTLDHFMHMRPIPGYSNYRTPIEGLYLCSAASHPGGGVTGQPGANAAREILADR